jgi:hypothetical protein
VSQDRHENDADRLRSHTESVLSHHLNAFSQGIEELIRDYDDRSILMTPEQSLRGRDEIRKFFTSFLDSASADFWNALNLKKVAVEGEIAYIAWAAPPFVSMAADTLLIRDGVILTQTFTSVPGM